MSGMVGIKLRRLLGPMLIRFLYTRRYKLLLRRSREAGMLPSTDVLMTLAQSACPMLAAFDTPSLLKLMQSPQALFMRNYDAGETVIHADEPARATGILFVFHGYISDPGVWQCKFPKSTTSTSAPVPQQASGGASSSFAPSAPIRHGGSDGTGGSAAAAVLSTSSIKTPSVVTVSGTFVLASTRCFTDAPAPIMVVARSACLVGCLRYDYVHAAIADMPKPERAKLAALVGDVRCRVVASHFPLTVPFIRQSWISAGMHQSVLEYIIENRLAARCFFPGETVCKSGMPGHEVWFLRRGRVRLVIKGSNNHNTQQEKVGGSVEPSPPPQQIVEHVGPVLTLGEMSLVLNEKIQHTCIAETICDFWMLSRFDFEHLVGASPDLAEHINRVAVKMRSSWLTRSQPPETIVSFIAAALRNRVPYLATASPQCIDRIARYARPTVFKMRRPIASTADWCTHLWVIARGVASTQQLDQANRRPGERFGPGDVVGNTCVVSHRWPVTVAALTMVDAWAVPRDLLLAALSAFSLRHVAESICTAAIDAQIATHHLEEAHSGLLPVKLKAMATLCHRAAVSPPPPVVDPRTIPSPLRIRAAMGTSMTIEKQRMHSPIATPAPRDPAMRSPPLAAKRGPRQLDSVFPWGAAPALTEDAALISGAAVDVTVGAESDVPPLVQQSDDHHPGRSTEGGRAVNEGRGGGSPSRSGSPPAAQPAAMARPDSATSGAARHALRGFSTHPLDPDIDFGVATAQRLWRWLVDVPSFRHGIYHRVAGSPKTNKKPVVAAPETAEGGGEEVEADAASDAAKADSSAHPPSGSVSNDHPTKVGSGVVGAEGGKVGQRRVNIHDAVFAVVSSAEHCGQAAPWLLLLLGRTQFAHPYFLEGSQPGPLDVWEVADVPAATNIVAASDESDEERTKKRGGSSLIVHKRHTSGTLSTDVDAEDGSNMPHPTRPSTLQADARSPRPVNVYAPVRPHTYDPIVPRRAIGHERGGGSPLAGGTTTSDSGVDIIAAIIASASVAVDGKNGGSGQPSGAGSVVILENDPDDTDDDPLPPGPIVRRYRGGAREEKDLLQREWDRINDEATSTVRSAAARAYARQQQAAAREQAALAAALHSDEQATSLAALHASFLRPSLSSSQRTTGQASNNSSSRKVLPTTGPHPPSQAGGTINNGAGGPRSRSGKITK